MELADYRDDFLKGLSGKSRAFTRDLEHKAGIIKEAILERGTNPMDSDLEQAKGFLQDVEYWKADCREEQAINAVRNEPRQIWDALRGAAIAVGDRDALLAIMHLVGFGYSKDENSGQRRAKRATAVLRFLDPQQWGVVDWRTAAIIGWYAKCKQDIDTAIREAKRRPIGQAASDFDLINEDAAIEYVLRYRRMRNERLPRTVDVELAFYGASFHAWQRPAAKSGRRSTSDAFLR